MIVSCHLLHSSVVRRTMVSFTSVLAVSQLTRCIGFVVSAVSLLCLSCLPSSSGQLGVLLAAASLQVNRSYSIVSAGNTSLCVSVPLSAGGAAPTGVTALSMAACNASASSQRWLYLSNQRLQSLDGVAQDYMQAYGGCGLNNSVVAYVRSSAPGTNEQWSYNSSAAALTLSICARQYCLCISAASNPGSGQPAGGQSLIVAGCSTRPPLHSQWLFAPVNSSDPSLPASSSSSWSPSSPSPSISSSRPSVPSSQSSPSSSSLSPSAAAATSVARIVASSGPAVSAAEGAAVVSSSSSSSSFPSLSSSSSSSAMPLSATGATLPLPHTSSLSRSLSAVAVSTALRSAPSSSPYSSSHSSSSSSSSSGTSFAAARTSTSSSSVSSAGSPSSRSAQAAVLSSLSSSSAVALQLAGYYTPGSTYYIVPLTNTSLCLSVPLSADGAVQGGLVTLQLRLCNASASYQRFTFLPSGLINVADGVVNASLQAYGGCIVNSVLRQYPGDSGSSNELWAYSTDSQQLSVCSTLCLTVNASSAVADSVQLMQLCSQRSALQQWLFGHFSSAPSPPFKGSTGAAWASTTSSSSSSVPTALAPSQASDIDVITIKGQSNAQGRGYYLNATLDTYSGGALYQYVIGDEYSCNDDPGVSTCSSVKGLAGLVLPLQQEPLLDAWPTTNSPYDVQIGFALRWGRTYLADHPGRTLIIVQAAVGGTGFSNGFWAAPSEVLYLRARNATNAVMRMFPNARNLGWLWCQGEADSSMVQSAYQSYLSQLISTDRATTVGANASTPFAILSINPYTAPVATAQVQLALKAMPSLVAYTSWTLGPGNSSNSSYSDINVTADSQHYDAAAQRINGVNLYQGCCKRRRPARLSHRRNGRSAPLRPRCSCA